MGGPEPEWLSRLAGTWSEHHPDWVVEEWSDDNVGELFPLYNQDVYDRAELIAPNNVGQLRSDVLRLEILARFGGVYIDSDFECCKPIDRLIEDRACFVARVDDRWINNAIIGCLPGDPFIAALVSDLADNVKRNSGFKPNRMTGPQYLTKVFNAGDFDVDVLPAELFYPYRWDDLDGHKRDYPDAYAIHHWHNQRREKGVAAP